MRDRSTTASFIEQAIKKRGDKFDYSKVEYTSSRKKVKITCKKHLIEFMQLPYAHLTGYNGCRLCQKRPRKDQLKLKHDNFLSMKWV